MKIEQIYNKEKHEVLWSNVWKINEFKTLLNTEQSHKWHQEGCVGTHTEMVVDEMLKMVNHSDMDDFTKDVLILSALFHDIGKGNTTFFNKERNDWSSIGHAESGEKIVRSLLKDEDAMLVECICYFVRNHMKLSYICESSNGIRDIIFLSCDTRYPSVCNIKNLNMLKECDNYGAIFNDDGWKEKLSFVVDLSKELDCFDKPYSFGKHTTKYVYFNDSVSSYPQDAKYDTTFEAFILIGNPKKFNAKSEYDKELRILSDDDANGDIIDQIIEACEDGVNFTLNLEKLPNKMHEMLFSMIYLYKGKITFVYGNENVNDNISPVYSMSYMFSES